jgi:hypothetical protein
MTGSQDIPARPLDRWLILFFAFAFGCGVVLRLVWGNDMEWKGDEQWSFERVRDVDQMEHPLLALGMDTSIGPANPGMSWLVFAGLAKVFRVEKPVELGRAVQTLNVLGLALLLLFAWRTVVPRDRESWLWAGALAAVSPIAVVLERKIWPPSVFPFFCVVSLWGWQRRDRWWGAILWGGMCTLLGQFHMSGFFFAAAFVGWEVLFGEILPRVDPVRDEPLPPRPRTKWLGWAGGAVLGAIPMLPWLGYLHESHPHFTPARDAQPSLYFWRLWFADTFGQGLDFQLGDDYAGFLRWQWPPITFTYPTVALLGVSFSIGVYLIAAGLELAWRNRRTFRRVWTVVFASDTAFVCTASFIGFGLLISSAGTIRQHYSVVLYPIEWLACATLALAAVKRPRALLLTLWTAQFALSMTFLAFIHDTHGTRRGDYGITYGAQHPRE